jgi:hypothetical protein
LAFQHFERPDFDIHSPFLLIWADDMEIKGKRLSAIVFRYREVLDQPVEGKIAPVPLC